MLQVHVPMFFSRQVFAMGAPGATLVPSGMVTSAINSAWSQDAAATVLVLNSVEGITSDRIKTSEKRKRFCFILASMVKFRIQVNRLFKDERKSGRFHTLIYYLLFSKMEYSIYIHFGCYFRYMPSPFFSISFGVLILHNILENPCLRMYNE